MTEVLGIGSRAFNTTRRKDVKTLYGIGIGPGDPELITLKAIQLIKHCNYVFVPEKKGKRLAETIASEYLASKKIIVLHFHKKSDNGNPYKTSAMMINETQYPPSQRQDHSCLNENY